MMLKESFMRIAKKNAKNKKEFKLFNTHVQIKDPLPENVHLEAALMEIKKIIPSYLFHEIDVIYVGQFKELLEKEVNAMYKDGAIYLTNNQDNNSDIVDDIIHELAHALEELYGNEIIYNDQSLHHEFIVKRTRLKERLRKADHDIEKYDFYNTEYSKEIDMLFYREIGYQNLYNFINGLYVSAYSATSLREYFAEGFEEYYLGDRRYLAYINPKLYEKIEQIDSLKEN